MKLADVDIDALDALDDEQFKSLTAKVLKLDAADRRESQILYYRPVSERAGRIHSSQAHYIGIGGGNRSSKTTTVLAELAMLATGMWPADLDDVIRPKFRGPVAIRVVVESLTTTLHSTILPKLQWWRWEGAGEPDSDQGHWGWIPRAGLVNGTWKASWSESLRTLTVLCRDPDDPDSVLGHSSFQFMSHDNDPSDFASGEFHHVLIDEPTRYAIYRENRARVRSVNGRIILAFTWPDDPSFPVEWIFDEIYERANGPSKHPDYDWFDLWTTENPHIDQGRVRADMEMASATERAVRFYGQPIRFSNLIHPLFTDIEQRWCLVCGGVIIPDYEDNTETCPTCRTREIVVLNHVADEMTSDHWPCYFLLDPHPRKPHMFAWVQVRPDDDLYVVCDGEVEGEPADVAQTAREIEESLRLRTVVRLIDPNMGRSPASARRGVTWMDEFRDADLACDLADDADVGRSRINEYLKPDRHTERPRILFHPRCHRTIFQMKRYTWDEHRRQDERDVKQKARMKYDDYPTLLKYCLNDEPQFRRLHGPMEPVPIGGRRRRGAYG